MRFRQGYRQTGQGMALTEQDFISDDLHPIDLVESLAEVRQWSFDRIADDQITMAVEGQWRSYAITLAWSEQDETLRLICTFEMAPPPGTLPALFEVLNRTNDSCWAGAFTYWEAQRLMVYRYGLLLSGGQVAGIEQVETLIRAAVQSCERFYPAFQMATWGGHSAEEAMQVAMAEIRGHA